MNNNVNWGMLFTLKLSISLDDYLFKILETNLLSIQEEAINQVLIWVKFFVHAWNPKLVNSRKSLL